MKPTLLRSSRLLMVLLLALSGCAAPSDGAAQSAGGSAVAEAAEPEKEHAPEYSGEELYFKNCAGCHGRAGQGAPDAYPALRGNALVNGPYGPMLMPPMFGRGAMPGFTQLLDDEDMAKVLSYIRTAWGNTGGPISAGQVAPFRHGPSQVPLDPFQGEH